MLAYAGEPPGWISITFDDARQSQYDNALPIMRQHGLVGTLYVNTAEVNMTNPPNSWRMSWPELREWQADGWEIADHTVTHADLTTLSDAEIMRELTDSAKVIEQQTGQFPKSFAFPFGRYNDQVLAAARKLFQNSVGGWIGTEKHGGGFNVPGSVDRYLVSRFEVERDTPVENVCAMVKKASDEHLWLVLVMHQVVSKPLEGPDGMYGVSVDNLTTISNCIAQAVQQGQVRVATVSEALAQLSLTD